MNTHLRRIVKQVSSIWTRIAQSVPSAHGFRNRVVAGVYLRLRGAIALMVIIAPWTWASGQSAFWQQGTLGPLEVTVMGSSLSGSGTVLWAGTTSGLHRSTNDGLSWSVVNGPVSSASVLTIHSVGERVWIGATNGLYLTKDAGVSWTPLYTDPVSPGVYEFIIDGSGAYFISVMDPATQNFRNVYRSNDQGSTWESAGAGLVGEMRVLSFLVVGNNNFALTGQGLTGSQRIYRWNPSGGNWSVVSLFNPAPLVFELASTSTGQWLVGTEDGLLSSDDQGGTWQNGGLDGLTCQSIVGCSDGTVWVGTNNAGAFMRAPNTTAWQQFATGIPSNPVQPNVPDPVRSIHRSLSGPLYVGTRDFGECVFVPQPLDWITAGSGNWNGAANWSDSNTPDTGGERARHVLGSTGGVITLPAGYGTSIHSFESSTSSASRSLLLRAGASLASGSFTNLTPGSGLYAMEVRSGASLTTASIGNGFLGHIRSGGTLTITGSVTGGTWQVGTPCTLNSSSTMVRASAISGGAWTVYQGASLGTSSQPIGHVLNTQINFSDPVPSMNTGGRLHVSGDMLGGRLFAAPPQSGIPSEPCRISIGGTLSGAQVDLIGPVLQRPCNSSPENRARITVSHLGPPVVIGLVGFDVELLPGGTIDAGYEVEWEFGDVEFITPVAAIIGGRVTFRQVGIYTVPGPPAGPGALIGSIGSTLASSGAPCDINLEGGWIEVGPGPSVIRDLVVFENAANSCGFSYSALDAHSSGLDLQVTDLEMFGGSINRSNKLGTQNTNVTVIGSLSVPLLSTAEQAVVRAGVVVMEEQAYLNIPISPMTFPSASIIVQREWNNRSNIQASGNWEGRGARLAVELDEQSAMSGPPVPPLVTLEAHNVDWGPHWFCQPSGEQDPRIKPWGELIVSSGARARVVDQHSVTSGFPNDDHGAIPSLYPNEAIYVESAVVVESGATLDLNGYNIYCRGDIKVYGTVTNGSVTAVTSRPYGTFDLDEDIDLLDLDILMAAFTGPGGITNNVLCDSDGDYDVDDDDVATFDANFTGPDLPADCGEKRLAIKPALLAEQLVLSPNPSAASVHLSGLSSVPLHVRITDATGRSMNITWAAADLDVSRLPQGVYNVEVRTSTGLLHRTLIVSR